MAGVELSEVDALIVGKVRGPLATQMQIIF